MIGIIGAMDKEISGLLDKLTDPIKRQISGITYYSGKIQGKECVISKCWPGKVNAAVCCEAMIMSYNPEFIINTGIAGGIGQNAEIGDLVIADKCIQYDFSTHEIDGLPDGYIQGIEMSYFSSDKKLSELFCKMAENIYKGKVTNGIIATGDRFVADDEYLKKLRKDFGADACDMESGSIAHVCWLNNKPFVILRSISDNADSNAVVDYPLFASDVANKNIELILAIFSSDIC
jgi:adenosylhomocysteine nucleosidase